MSRVSATRRASSTAPSAQQASSRWISGMLGKSGQTFNVTPITSCPACFNSAAVTELSTPPDIPTMTFAIRWEILAFETDFDDVACLAGLVLFEDAPGANLRTLLVLQPDKHPQRR